MDPKNTILAPFKIDGYLTPNVKIDPIFEIYTELSSIWYIELYVWTNEREPKRSQNNAAWSEWEDIDRWGEFVACL